MNYAAIKTHDVANGPGVRVSLFVSGCTHGCKGCFNKEAWDFDYGRPFADKVTNEIIDALKPDYIAGFSLLGGEPFEPSNQEVLVRLLRLIKAKYPQKSIWCYTGYLLDRDLLGDSKVNCEHTREMLGYIDYLVDGEYVEEKKDLNIKFRGSSNQRLIDVRQSLKGSSVVTIPDDADVL